MRDGLKVSGVAACLHFAEVVDFKAFADGTNVMLVHEAVSANDATIEPYLPISVHVL